ncbi:methionyl-tRNA formyltransferase [Candidatus Acetothermia bacterium]|nr:methionyl-tRNA formyltransferase [Candidatus Acetothermia bacterium]MBI3643743.1 methionyl-tRNA formyltransferase [Candidatus Acetothermia bacterium]
MRLLFLGTGSLGLPTLRALIQSNDHQLLAIFTQPDRPAGRGLKLKASPIKEFALEHQIPVYQPEKINRDLDQVRSYNPDVIVVAAYGQILSKELLSIPPQGTINIHASLLPKYRGAAPIQWALIHGESETGITTFLLNERLDTGDLMLKRAIPITEDDTAGSLEAKLAELGSEVIFETLDGIATGKLKAQPQDHLKATLAPKIKKELAQLDWTKSAKELFNLIRGLNPSPGAYTFYKGKRLKIHRSRVASINAGSATAGEVIQLNPQGLILKTGDNSLELTEVQPEGKKALTGTEFVRGYQIKIGDRLGLN